MPTSSCSCRYTAAVPGALQGDHILNHIFLENPARFSQCLAILPKAFCCWQVKMFAVLLSLSHSHAGNIAMPRLLSPAGSFGITSKLLHQAPSWSEVNLWLPLFPKTQMSLYPLPPASAVAQCHTTTGHHCVPGDNTPIHPHTDSELPPPPRQHLHSPGALVLSVGQ